MKTLLVGYTASDLFERGKHGRRFTASWIDPASTTCHTLDIYQRHAIEKTHHLKTICSPHLPEGPWDLIKFRTGPKEMSGELSLDLLQEIHLLKPAKFELDFVGRERDRNELLAKIRDDPDRVRNFAAKWRSSVPGGTPLEFTSYPGCFCHRRQDEGGLALAEVVCRDLAAGLPATKLLDMGCGCGLVGLLVAGFVRDRSKGSDTPTPPDATQRDPTRSDSGGFSLVGVDSHSRAIEAANANAAAQGIAAEFILADNGTPARMDGSFDVFVGNPPYYSDYRIADVFLETAARALKPGGVCYTVCKNAAGLEPIQRRRFPQVEIIPRRGYAVLKSFR